MDFYQFFLLFLLGLVNFIVEILVGSRNKYEYFVEVGVMVFDWVMYFLGCYFFDYGFIFNMLVEDGFFFDVMVIMVEFMFVGCLIKVCFIGVLDFYDWDVYDGKIFCVLDVDFCQDEICSICQIVVFQLEDVVEFFRIYCMLQGSVVLIDGWCDFDVVQLLFDFCINVVD